jgi:hypothetical protein
MPGSDVDVSDALNILQSLGPAYSTPTYLSPDRYGGGYSSYSSYNSDDEAGDSENISPSIFSSRPVYKGRGDVRERHARVSRNLFGHGGVGFRSKAKTLVIR